MAPTVQPLVTAAAALFGGGRQAPILTLVPLNPERRHRPEDDWAAQLVAVGERQDRDAFGRLFEHFAPRVKRYLMQSGSPESQADELTQEALVAVWRKAALFDAQRAAASTWIFTIARNLRVDLLRRRQGAEAAPDEPIDFDTFDADEPPPDERLHASRLADHLRRALAQLPLEQQEVLRLCYFHEESHAHIAATLGVPLGTVKSRVRLALAALRRRMDR